MIPMIERLKELGLDGKKAKVYMALLQNRGMSASEIAKTTKLKRPTVYDLLDELMERNLVSAGFAGNVKIFSAEDPEKITADLAGLLEKAEAIMPDLKRLYEQNPGRPRVKYYEGVDGIKTVCEDILNVKAGEYHYFGSLHEMFMSTGWDYQDYYVKRRIKKGIWSNAIRIREKEVDDEFMKSGDKNLRRVRFFPGHIDDDIPALFIYDNKIAIHSGLQENFGMIIESRELSNLMRAVWKCVWLVSVD